MNAWKIIWNTFYKESSRRRVAIEMWRLSSGRERSFIVVSTSAFLVSLGVYWFCDGHPEIALVSAVCAEVALLLMLDKIKDNAFFSEYGHADNAMGPPDQEEQRGSRYMIFRKRLREANITRSHVQDAFILADAKLDLESSRGEMPKKYLGVTIGLLTGTLIAWSRNFTVAELGLAVTVLVAGSFPIVMILWIIPSRAERLKELKYFMHLYCREVE